MFNDTFASVFEYWQRKHFGFRIPDDLDPLVEDALIGIESHYERQFSQAAVIIKYLEALLKRGI